MDAGVHQNGHLRISGQMLLTLVVTLGGALVSYVRTDATVHSLEQADARHEAAIAQVSAELKAANTTISQQQQVLIFLCTQVLGEMERQGRPSTMRC